MDDLINRLTAILPAKYRETIVLFAILSPYITRSVHALMNGKGIKGVFSAIWCGTNTPKQVVVTATEQNKQ